MLSFCSNKVKYNQGVTVFISMKAVSCVWIYDYLNDCTWNGRVELHTSIIIETSGHACQSGAMI